jgi:hypothetical protein
MRRIVIIAALFLLGLPAAAGAATRYPVVGFGEQRASVFSDPHWQELGLPHVRLVVGWDALRYKWQRHEIDQWMESAEAAGAEPLLAFTRSRSQWRKRQLPTPDQFARAFLGFRERYPFVDTFLTWNEANHCSQPLCRRPELAARYFDVLTSNCPECKIVAADVLDTDDMVPWLRRFRQAARHRPKIWGLHNYLDANRLRTTGTQAMLHAVSGEIWFTETGGVVKRKGSSPLFFPESASHAAKATQWVLTRLARLSPRIKRIYLYHFENQGPGANWDSGVLDRHGRPRPAFRVVQRWVSAAERARRAHESRVG